MFVAYWGGVENSSQLKIVLRKFLAFRFNTGRCSRYTWLLFTSHETDWPTSLKFNKLFFSSVGLIILYTQYESGGLADEDKIGTLSEFL